MASTLSKYVKRDYYAEERTAEIAKSKIVNGRNQIKPKPISDLKANKISELELELKNLKATNETSKAEAHKIKNENKENQSKKDLEINRLKKELLVFNDRYDRQFLKRVLSVLWDDYEMKDESELYDLVIGVLSEKPKLQANRKIYEVVFDYAGENFDFDEEEEDKGAEIEVAQILGSIFTQDDCFKMYEVIKSDPYCVDLINEMNRKIRIRY